MTPDVITRFEQVTPAWLTGVLLRSGGLTAGAVAAARIRIEDSVNARIAWLTLTYDESAAGERPERLFLKLCEGDIAATPSEVLYYTRDYQHAPDAPLPRCYDAVYAATERCYHILLADLSASHQNSHGHQPSLGYGFALADALAALHAPHWNSAPLHTAAEVERYVAEARGGLRPMIEHLGAALPEQWRSIMERVFDAHPARMLARLGEPNGFTLIHGDPNPGNVLRPRIGRGRVYLIDRQPFEWSLTTWLGVSDLSYAIAHWWPTPARRAHELPMLKRYHRKLVRHGVRDYDFAALFSDYRACLPISLYVAVSWCAEPADVERMKWVWWPQLQRALRALIDHAA